MNKYKYMEFIKDNYKVIVLEDYEGINIYLYEVGDENPMLFLNLKPLHPIDTSLDDRTVVRDIPRRLFKTGDFYQSSVMKYITTDFSLLSILHGILLENNEDLHFIKHIFSTSLNNYREENFITEPAKKFWDKQLEKASTLPVTFYEADKRYLLKIND